MLGFSRQTESRRFFLFSAEGYCALPVTSFPFPLSPKSSSSSNRIQTHTGAVAAAVKALTMKHSSQWDFLAHTQAKKKKNRGGQTVDRKKKNSRWGAMGRLSTPSRFGGVIFLSCFLLFVSRTPSLLHLGGVRATSQQDPRGVRSRSVVVVSRRKRQRTIAQKQTTNVRIFFKSPTATVVGQAAPNALPRELANTSSGQRETERAAGRQKP